ncbi:hypothetical protein BDP27DRAFT_1321481 [Rhodocollybia butyracea]|uniref:Uncharacterized protein n=1 Tax=Rhodocollybia butyracea TaxID=206335 RepID=A0A9P5U9B7_9AGAR|nr:hypothetical protein BDP27DRAFT_1321481 [Rhodocollybia butyracea]
MNPASTWPLITSRFALATRSLTNVDINASGDARDESGSGPPTRPATPNDGVSIAPDAGDTKNLADRSPHRSGTPEESSTVQFSCSSQCKYGQLGIEHESLDDIGLVDVDEPEATPEGEREEEETQTNSDEDTDVDDGTETEVPSDNESDDGDMEEVTINPNHSPFPSLSSFAFGTMRWSDSYANRVIMTIDTNYRSQDELVDGIKTSLVSPDGTEAPYVTKMVEAVQKSDISSCATGTRLEFVFDSPSRPPRNRHLGTLAQVSGRGLNQDEDKENLAVIQDRVRKSKRMKREETLPVMQDGRYSHGVPKLNVHRSV